MEKVTKEKKAHQSTFKMVCYEIFRKSKYRLDEYPVKDGKKHPFAIICPGGGYRMVANHVEGLPIAKKLNQAGYAAFVLWYGCNGNAAYPAPVNDVAHALKDIISRADELGIDKDNYSIWGASAGGHLAALFGTESVGWKAYDLPCPNSLVLIYPVISMGKLAHKGSKKRILGKKPTEEMVELLSVEMQVTENYPPTFIWCGEKDKCVKIDNSEIMAEALTENGVKHELEIYPQVGHGVGLGEGTACQEWFGKAVSFLNKINNRHSNV